MGLESLFGITNPALSDVQRRQIFGDFAGFMREYYPQMLRLSAEHMPAQQDAENRRQMIAMEGIGETPGAIDLLSRNAHRIGGVNRELREWAAGTDAELVEQYGGRFHQQDKAANRELYELMGAQDRQSGLSGALQQQAIGSLAVVPQLDTGYAQMNAPLHDIYQQSAAAVERGGQLTPEQQRIAEQEARTAGNDRGMFRSAQNIGAELFSTDAARKRQQLFDQQTLAQAGGMINQNVASNMAGRASLLQSAAGIDAQTFGQQQARIGNRAATRFDPTNAVLGRPVVGQMGPMQGYGAGAGLASAGANQGMGLFDQFMTGAGNMYGIQQGAQNAYASAKADQNAGLFGFLGNAFGGPIGQGLGAVWDKIF